MLKLIGCFGRLIALALLLGLIALAWTKGPDLWRTLRQGDDVGALERSSEELSADAVNRYRDFLEADSGSVSFSGEEIEGVLRHRLSDRIPRGGAEPTVRLSDGEAVLGIRLPSDSIPLPPDLERGRSVLPDRVTVLLYGTFVPRDNGTIFMVRRVDVAGLPVPRQVFERVLAHLGGGGDTLPVEALPLPLPPGASEVYIDEDRLVLLKLR